MIECVMLFVFCMFVFGLFVAKQETILKTAELRHELALANAGLEQRVVSFTTVKDGIEHIEKVVIWVKPTDKWGLSS